MSTDPDNAEPPSGLEDMLKGLADIPGDPKLLADFQRLLERVQRLPRSDKPEPGDARSTLDIDKPSFEPAEPLEKIGYALLRQLPEHWETVVLEITAAADDVRTSAIVRMQDGPQGFNFRFFADLTEPSLALRQATYEPEGRGAWYNARIKLVRDGTIIVIYDYETPPFGCWGEREVALAIRDHELYPRDPERLPSWHPSR